MLSRNSGFWRKYGNYMKVDEVRNADLHYYICLPLKETKKS